MAKLTLKDITSGFLATQVINDNNALIEALVETFLSRDGLAPNGMLDTLDMNSNRIINTLDPLLAQDVATKSYVDSILAAGIADQAGNAGLFLTTDGSVTSWADPLPDQSGEAGNFLTTNGTVAAWAGGTFLPSPLVANRLVSNDGATPSWRLDFLLTANTLAGDNTNAGALLNIAASSTVPTVVGDKADPDSGLTLVTLDEPGIVSGGVLAVSWAEASSGVLQANQMNTGLTASAVQTQGQAPLLSSYNEVSTVANTNDVVTLPAAVVGQQVTVVNNGASDMQIFPASGEDLGEGVDTSVVLSAGGTLQLLGTASGVYAQAFNLGLFGNFTDTQFCASNPNGPCMQNEASSLTNPTFVPDQSDVTSGLGGDTGSPALIALGSTVAVFDGVGTNVNYFTVAASDTGFPVVLAAEGADADVLLGITGKGAGGVSLAGGQSATVTADGGPISLVTGEGGATSGDSGDLTLATGVVTSGTVGNILLSPGTVLGATITGTAIQLSSIVEITRANDTGSTLIDGGNGVDTASIRLQGGAATNPGEMFLKAAIFNFQEEGAGPSTIFTIDTTLGRILAANAAGPAILNEVAAFNNPTLVPERGELTTGIGKSATGTLTVIGGGQRIADFLASAGTGEKYLRFQTGDDNDATSRFILSTQNSGGTDSFVDLEIVPLSTGSVYVRNSDGGGAGVRIRNNNITADHTTLTTATRLTLKSFAGGSTRLETSLSSTGVPGDIELLAIGAGSGNQGGNVRILGGNGNTAGAGGDLDFDGGPGGNVGPGGDVLLTSGQGGFTSGDSGDVIVDTGTVTSGTIGDILFNRGGIAQFEINALGFFAANASGPAVKNEASTSTNPVYNTIKSDVTTGIGGAAGEVSLIAGSVEQLTADSTGVGFFGTAPVGQSAAYTRNATIVEDRTLLASASATILNNNNVLAALIADLQAIGILG